MNNHIKESEHGDSPFVLMELYYPKDDHFEDLMAIAKSSVKVVRDQPGLIQYQVLQPTNAKEPISNIAVWRSKADFQTFMQSDEFKELVKSDDVKKVQEWSTDIKTMMFNIVDGWHINIK